MRIGYSTEQYYNLNERDVAKDAAAERVKKF